jgi:predicted transcriptional regulator
MTEGEGRRLRGDRLVEAMQMARFRSRRARASAVQAISAAAETEENLAATLERIADQHPARAKRLRAMSEAARRQAVLAWKWARDRQSGGMA